MNWKQTASLDAAIEHGLKKEEYLGLVESLGRDLNLLELGICSALFSEHCSYKSTKIHLQKLPTTGERVIIGPGENAGVMDIGDGDAICFKVESHNSPTFIEPFQGAATGVGGILRDVFTMGARPLALMNSLRFGEKKNSKTKHLFSGAVAGIGGYGNCMGIPTLGGELFFHKAYNGNCLVNAFALGLVRTDKIFTGLASGVGNSIIYVGSKTGRDGIHGATMSSNILGEDLDSKRPTVQVGDPFQEKLLLEACLEVMRTGVVIGIQDMGAAGLTSSAFEMADRANTGVRMDLDKVPQRETNMSPYELMLSESQERMLIVVERGREQAVYDIFTHWDLDAVKIGEVIEGENVELYWNGELASSMPVKTVTQNVPVYDWPIKQPDNFEERNACNFSEISEPEDLSKTWLELLASINLCSRAPVYEQYDTSVRSNSEIFPGGDAGVIRIKPNESFSLGDRSVPKDTDISGVKKGVAVTIDNNSLFCSINPKLGTEHTVAECYRNITAVGATPIGISDCLNFGSPEKPEGMWEIATALEGLGEAAKVFKTPIISGNVSLYNESIDSRILPTPMIAMAGLMKDSSKAVSIAFKNEGDVVFVLGETKGEVGGSVYLSEVHDLELGPLPELDFKAEIKTGECIRKLIENSMLHSSHDISSGGLALALAECSFTNKLGVEIALLEDLSIRPDFLMFGESPARYIISCSRDSRDKVVQVIQDSGINIAFEGKVGGDNISIRNSASISLAKAVDVWESALKEMF